MISLNSNPTLLINPRIPWNKGTTGIMVAWNKGLKGKQVAWNKGMRGIQVAWNKGKKLSESHCKALSESHKGKESPRKGKKNSPEHIEKTRLKNLGRKQSDEEKKKRGLSLRGKRLGKKSNLWRGGINPLREVIRGLAEDTEWKKKVFARDNYTCQMCFKRGLYIEAHHIKEFSIIFREFINEYKQYSPIKDKYALVALARQYHKFWDINNGLTLCKQCHDEVEHNKSIYEPLGNKSPII